MNNTIYNSVGLGIDLGNDGVTANDGADADIGPNALQNTPVLSLAMSNGSQVMVAGMLDSAANSFYRIDFGFSTLLGRLSDRPFQWGTSIPIDAGSSVTYFVQACDLAGLCTSSQPVTIGVFR